MVAEISLRIAGGPDAPSDARRALRRFHPELTPELIQTATLLTSELVSNAVRHGRAEAIAFHCQLTLSHVRIEVADEGPAFQPEPSPLEPDRTYGWGLFLVDQLADRWGVADTRTTKVWFEIDR